MPKPLESSSLLAARRPSCPKPAPSAIAEFLIAIAGPAVSLTLAAFFYALQPLVSSIQSLLGLIKYLAYINFALVVFNLIPGFPLDGGRVIRAIVWAVTKNMRRATLIAATMGRFFGFSFIFLRVLKMFAGDIGDGVWIALIGWFLDNAASGQVHLVMFQGLLEGHKVSQAMSSHCPLCSRGSDAATVGRRNMSW